jgi:DNA-binding transcriptional MerR regulator
MKQKPSNNPEINGDRPENPIDSGPMLKMKELVEATGLSKATILYYINVGLLPKPVKTNPNVAFYPSSYVEKLGFIKQLQSRHRLSLSQIKSVLKEKSKGREVSPLIELNNVIFGQKEETICSDEKLCEICGLDMENLETALRLKLLNPKTENQYDSEDIAVGRILKRCLELGLDLEDLEYYPRLASKIVTHEIETRRGVIHKKSFEEILSITLELTGIARSFRGYVIDRIFQQSVLKEQLNGDNPVSEKRTG